MIHDLVLRWVVTGLFVLTAAECVLAIVGKRRPWAWVVSHGLHFVMALAMVMMAWPSGAQLPSTGPTVFFPARGHDVRDDGLRCGPNNRLAR